MSEDNYSDGGWRTSSRREKQVVLYNEDEKRVILQSNPNSPQLIERQPQSVAAVNPPAVCVLCKRPLDSCSPSMDRRYFEFLSTSFQNEESLDEDEDIFSDIRNIPLAIFNQGYYAKFFKEGRKLGRGARGSVFTTTHILDNEVLGEYAVKKVPVGDNSEWLVKMLKEVHVMERLRNPNIVTYKHTWLEVQQLTLFGPPIPCLFILMELANGGNLEDFVIDLREAAQHFLTIDEVLWIFQGICKGLAHLHSLSIIHRDLKPSNILLNFNEDGSNGPVVLISDFGECNTLNESLRRDQRSGATGTIEFCAPELFHTDKDGKYTVRHSKKTDSWSLGMILYFLLFAGSLPYQNVEDVEVLREDLLHLRRVNIPNIRKDIPPSLLKLLKSLLSLDPSKRPSAMSSYEICEQLLLSKPMPSNVKKIETLKLTSNAFEERPNVFKGTVEASDHSASMSFYHFLWIVALFCVSYPKSPHWIVLAMSSCLQFLIAKTNISARVFFPLFAIEALVVALLYFIL